jgi:hypothetical protein
MVGYKFLAVEPHGIVPLDLQKIKNWLKIQFSMEWLEK